MLFVVVGALEGLETGVLDVVEFVIASDGFFEGLDTGTLDLVVAVVVFAVDLDTLVVTAVDASVVGLDPDDFVLGVGWAATGVPVHVTPLSVVFMPLGQRHVWDLILIFANKHKWLHPPLFTSHGLEAEGGAYMKIINCFK